jgi:hypothetical protein
MRHGLCEMRKNDGALERPLGNTAIAVIVVVWFAGNGTVNEAV